VHYVYLIESESTPGRRYVGSSSNLKRRMDQHNSGRSLHTRKYMPWRLATYLAFSARMQADEFERYLKSGSGDCGHRGMSDRGRVDF
jgi:putative endonuclease